MYLQSQEEYFPSDIEEHLKHVLPVLRGQHDKQLPGCPSPLTLSNLDALNTHGGKDVFLKSHDDVTTNPAWMKGGRPDAHGKTSGAKICCVMVNDHGLGSVDAFYIYFYSFNKGQTIFAKELGDHVGDWSVSTPFPTHRED